MKYRKVDVAVYGSASFRALSPPPPSAQTLYIYLLTGPHTTPIPGLFPATPGQLADRLGWSRRAFDRCWAELEAQHLAEADWAAGVVFIPSAIETNLPENPSVLTSWKDRLSDIPDCALKGRAVDHIAASLKPAWRPAWSPPAPQRVDQGVGQGVAQGVRQGEGQRAAQGVPHQEQEEATTEQEEAKAEQETPPLPPSPGGSESAPGFDVFWIEYPRKDKKQAALAAWRKLRPPLALQATMRQALEAQKRSDEWTRDGGRYVPQAVKWLNGRRWEDEPGANGYRRGAVNAAWAGREVGA